MKKLIAISVILYIVTVIANAQTPVFTWMTGSNDSNLGGIYNARIADNKDQFPAGRYSSISWTDTSGNFWLFGGGGGNGLWRYELANGEWTLMGGSDDNGQESIYGILGIGSTNNIPGSRVGSISWTDNSGNFW